MTWPPPVPVPAASRCRGLRILIRSLWMELWACWLLVAVLPVGGYAQQDMPEIAAPVGALAQVAESAWIAEADVLTREDQVAENLRRIEELAAPANEVAAIRQGFDDEAIAAEALLNELDGIDRRRTSLRWLDDHRQRWVDRQQRLDRWRGFLRQRWELLQRERRQVRLEHALWQRTRDAEATAEYPPELHLRIDTVLERLVAAEGLLDERIQSVAAVLDRISNQGEAAAEALQRLDGIENTVRRRIWARNLPPLWSPGPAAGTRSLFRG